MKIIKYRAYHSGQMLEVSAIDFKNRTIRVGGPVRIVRWREDNITDNGRINANGGEGTHFSSEMNGELSLDDPMQLPVFLMQYTGLLDRNGTKIFEGDVVREHFLELSFENPDDAIEISLVSFECGAFGFKPHAGEWQTFAEYPKMQCEVIGNIYANPELLK